VIETACDAAGVKRAQRGLKAQLRPEGERDVAEIFAALGDPTRLKLLYALSHGELCVGDLALLLGVSGSATSHHLQNLRALRLVKFRREGKMILYALDDEHVLSLLEVGAAHARESRRPRAAQPRTAQAPAAHAKVRRTSEVKS